MRSTSTKELAPDRGIAVWLVEARAVRVDEGPWAPLFTAVVQPNQFTASVERAKQDERPATLIQFWDQFASEDSAAAVRRVLDRWEAARRRRRLGPNPVVLEARGPAVSGTRTVVARADSLFGFGGTERQARTEPGWLTDERVEPL